MLDAVRQQEGSRWTAAHPQRIVPHLVPESRRGNLARRHQCSTLIDSSRHRASHAMAWRCLSSTCKPAAMTSAAEVAHPRWHSCCHAQLQSIHRSVLHLCCEAHRLHPCCRPRSSSMYYRPVMILIRIMSSCQSVREHRCYQYATNTPC